MATIILEANQSLDGKNVKVPKDVLRTLNTNRELIANKYGMVGSDQYKKSDGYKRNQRITSDGYNKRSENGTDEAGIISYNDLVKWKHDMDTSPKGEKSLSYQLNGGTEADTFVNGMLSHMRNSVKPVNQVKKSENITKASSRVDKHPMKPEEAESESIHVHEETERILNLIGNILKE